MRRCEHRASEVLGMGAGDLAHRCRSKIGNLTQPVFAMTTAATTATNKRNASKTTALNKGSK